MPEDDGAPYAVWQFFPDETHECVGNDLDMAAAVELAARMTRTLGARLGTTRRVIIVDGGDDTVFEWKFGQGVTWPKPQTSADVEGNDGKPPEGLSSE